MTQRKKKLLKPQDTLDKWLEFCESKKLTKKKITGKDAKRFAKMAGMKSMGEVRCAADMDDRKIKYNYEQDKIPYVIKATYNPDFTLYKDDDMLIEYKGKMTQTVRTKMAAIKKCNPDLRICMVFEKPNNKLSSKPNSMRYWRWAELHGFPWSEHYVKKEWFTKRFWAEWRRKNETV
jgi:hypothetical protein